MGHLKKHKKSPYCIVGGKVGDSIIGWRGKRIKRPGANVLGAREAMITQPWGKDAWTCQKNFKNLIKTTNGFGGKRKCLLMY